MLFMRTEHSDVNSSSDNNSLHSQSSTVRNKRPAEVSRTKEPAPTTPLGGHCKCCALGQDVSRQRCAFKKVRTWPHGITLLLSQSEQTIANEQQQPVSRSAEQQQPERSSSAESGVVQTRLLNNADEVGGNNPQKCLEPIGANSCVDIWRLRTIFEQRPSNDTTTPSCGGSLEQESESLANASIELRDFANWQSASTETHASTMRSFDTDLEMRTLQKELEAQLGRLVGVAAVERDDSGYRSIEQTNDGGSVSLGSKSSSRSHTLNRLLVDNSSINNTTNININNNSKSDDEFF
jgi:hypothetical protein